MARYKCLNEVTDYGRMYNKIFDGDYTWGTRYYTVKELSKMFPDQWELIIEKDIEKTITLSLNKARQMYGKSKEMDELLLANFSKEELEKPKLPKKWENLEKVNGYFIDDDSSIIPQYGLPHTNHKNTFTTEKQAKSTLAMAQLSQLMKAYNGDWTPKWSENTVIYVIRRFSNGIYSDSVTKEYEFLAFKTFELRDEFLKNFEDLIKQYFMID